MSSLESCVLKNFALFLAFLSHSSTELLIVRSGISNCPCTGGAEGFSAIAEARQTLLCLASLKFI